MTTLSIETSLFTGEQSVIFCFAEEHDVQRIVVGKQNPNDLPASQRYAIAPLGNSLVIDCVRHDGSVPPDAYRQFHWCGVDTVDRSTPLHELRIPDYDHHNALERYVLAITPKRLDGVFVVDQGRYIQELGKVLTPNGHRRQRLLECQEVVMARARTMTPLGNYGGGFDQPAVLFARKLYFDEVEVISGPWPEFKYVLILDQHNDDTRLLMRSVVAGLCDENLATRQPDKARAVMTNELCEYVRHDPSLWGKLIRAGYGEYSCEGRDHKAAIERVLQAAAEAHGYGVF